MFRMTLAGLVAVVVLGLAGAVAMVANAPAMSSAPQVHADDAGIARQAADNTVGRLVLTFEPASQRIDRN